MKINKKVLTLTLAVYVLTVSTICLNTSVAMLMWKDRRKKSQNLRKKLLLYNALLDVISVKEVLRKLRRKNKIRSYDWWERIVLTKFCERDWMEKFRVDTATFKYIVEELRTVLTPEDNFLNDHRKITNVEKKVGLTLYYLASCCEYRVVGNTFGIHKSTVHDIVHEVIDAINNVSLPKFIKMPNETEAVEIASLYEASTKLPNIIGAIDGTHIPLKPPKDGHRDFINRKGWASIVLQGVVDSKYRFIDICCKNPGATHDAAVLLGSDLFKNIKKVLPKSSVKIENQMVPYVILGDPAYPLLPWLIKGYPNRGITPEQDSFNVYMSSGRVAVEIAFGRLKARWRRLLKRCDMHYKFLPNIVAACATLHNIIESRKGRFQTSWMQDVEQAENIFPQPLNRICRNPDEYEAHTLRDFLCNYLSRNFPLRTSKQIT